MANRYVTSASQLTVGQEFGSYKIMTIDSPSSLCECQCGAVKKIRNSYMLAGRVGSCHKCANSRVRPGARSFESPLSKLHYRRLSALVRNVIRRCTDSSHPHWDRYGGRGITIDESWQDDPSKFVAYLSTLVGFDDPSLVVDREDNNQGYKPENLRFVTKSISQQNKGSYRRRTNVKH